MSFFEQIVVVLWVYFISLCFYRAFMNGLVIFYYSKNHRKRIIKEENIKDKFFYTKYRDRIPKTFYYLYYFILIFHLISLLLCIIFNQVESLNKYGVKVVGIVAIFDIIWMAVLSILFWGRNSGYKYDRWLKK